MFKINQELLEITKKQIESDLQDLDNFKIERIENFRKFVNNQAKSKDDLISIHFGVHSLRSKINLDFICSEKKSLESIDLKAKLGFIKLYYSETHFLSCL